MVRYIADSNDDAPTLHEPASNAHLVLLVEGRVSQSFPIRGQVALGRDKGNSIVVADQKVSRHHASLSSSGDAYIITDQGSANGTYLNGVLLTQPTRLKDMDHITVGDTHFRFSTTEPSSNVAISPQSAAVLPSTFPQSPAQAASVTLLKVNGRSMWVLVGCLALVIVGLLIVLAVFVGLFLGRSQAVGMTNLIWLADLM